MQRFLTAFGEIWRAGPRGLWIYFTISLLVFTVLGDWMLYRRPPSLPGFAAQSLRVVLTVAIGLGWAALHRCRQTVAVPEPEDQPRP